jgi:predicted dehydrogenase
MEIAVVGDGRWGMTLCGVLARLPQVGNIHLVSVRNTRCMQDSLAQAGLARSVDLHAKLDPVLWNPGITAALVANLPSEHFATARWLLENGKHVLVAHPFAQTRAEAQALADLAGAHGLVAAALAMSDGPISDPARDALASVAAEIASFLEATVERRGVPGLRPRAMLSAAAGETR